MSSRWEALKATLNQTAEAVQRNARIDIVSGGVDEIDPPEDLDEYADQARTTGIVRSNLRKWVNDVWEPGYRINGPDETVEFFTENMDVAPSVETGEETGWLEQAAILSGERNQDFYDFAKECTWQKWVRGTVLVEVMKNDPQAEDWKPTGFYFIRPETVNIQVENNTDILLPADPEDLPEDIDRSDIEETARGEVAAYIQFDDESIVGLRRTGGYDDDEIPLSQNDVLKDTLEPGIGADIADANNRTLTEASSVFGNSVIKAISEEITEYNQTKRDWFEGNQRKAYGVWTAQFTPEVIDLGERKEVIEWTDESIQNTENELQRMGPGDVLTSDANIDLEAHDPSVPDLTPVLEHYVDDILAALPVPKALTGFADNINRDVVSDQREAYDDLLSEERNQTARFWTHALVDVAERYDLPTDGLEFEITPPTEDNPVKSLDTETIERMNNYVATLNEASGPQAGPLSIVSREKLLEVLEFPVEEMDDPEQIADELSTEDTEAAWKEIMGVDALATQYSEGDVVQSPQGLGVVSGVFTEGFDDVEASSNSPTYAVALQDERVGSEFYKASELEATEMPETDVDEPAEEIEAMADIADATEYEALQGQWNAPESWEESDTPVRLIALDAWSSMGGQFDCGGACCKGTMAPKLGDRGSDEYCASFKDYILGTEEWRGWGA